MRAFLTAIGTFLILGALVFIAAYAILVSGLYNVAADGPERPLRNWLFQTTMDNSVRYHARKIIVPDLSSPEQFLVGFRHYDGMCVTCHGAPGVLPSEIGIGLRPRPPDLTHEEEELTPAAVYWITKHGIDMTGMPAFGRTHDEASLWAMTAFTLKLPELSPLQYDSLRQMFNSTLAPDSLSHH